MKFEWIVYAVALAVALGAYKIFSNSIALPYAPQSLGD